MLFMKRKIFVILLHFFAMATKKLFAFVHLLHECESFLDIELFYYKFRLFDSKWYSELEELEEYLFCPFDFSITH